MIHKAARFFLPENGQRYDTANDGTPPRIKACQCMGAQTTAGNISNIEHQPAESDQDGEEKPPAPEAIGLQCLVPVYCSPL